MSTMQLRFYWATILSFFVILGFKKSWKKEHKYTSHKGAFAHFCSCITRHFPNSTLAFFLKSGKEASDKQEETTVLISPLICAAAILFFPLMQIVLSRLIPWADPLGFISVCFLSLDILILFSVYFVILMIILPFLRKRTSARACALLWITPAFLFWQFQMVSLYQYIPIFQIYIPRKLLSIFFYIWFVGACCIFLCRLAGHLSFRLRIHKSAVPVEDTAVLSVLEEMQDRIGYHKELPLICSSAVSGPLSMGIFNRTRCLVLPDRDYREEELAMIFSHELHHLQRLDVETKIFLVFITSLCWVNPLVWIGAKKAAEDLELSCDEIVTEGMNMDERKSYALLLLGNGAPAAGFTTCLSAAAETLRYRMKHVVETRKKSMGILWLAASIILCTICYGLVSITTEKGSFTELVMTDGTELAGTGSTIIPADEDTVLSALSRIQLQKLENYYAYGRTGLGDSVDFTLQTETGKIYVKLYQHLLVTDNSDSGQTYYKVVSDLDWEALEAID